jgi:hypothetical protein
MLYMILHTIDVLGYVIGGIVYGKSISDMFYYQHMGLKQLSQFGEKTI